MAPPERTGLLSYSWDRSSGGDFLEDARGFGGGIGRARDLAAEDDVVGASANGFGGSSDALLIAFGGAGGADTRSNDQQIGSSDGADTSGIEGRRDHAIDAAFDSFAHAEIDERGDFAGIAEVLDILAIVAGEDGDGEQFETGAAAAFDGVLHDGLAAVDGEKFEAGAGDLADGAADGFADIVELHIEEDLLAAGAEFTGEGHTGGGVEFHADFVEANAVAEAFDQGKGFAGGLEIEGDDDGVVSHFNWTDFLARGSTRPMGWAEPKDAVSAAVSFSGRVKSRPPEVWGS